MKTLIIVLGVICLLGLGVWAGISFYKGYEDENKKSTARGIVASCLCLIPLLVLIIVPGSIHQVEAGQVAVVKVWGEAKEVRTSGLYYNFWISHKYEIYDCKVQQVPVKTNAYSSDSQPMDIELYIQYRIQQENAMNIAKNYGGLEMLESRIETVSIEKMKSVLSKYKAEELIQKRGTISPEVETNIREAITNDYYINISTVVLTNIDFSDAFEKSVEDKMIAEQEKLKAQYENEKAIAKAEADLEIAKKEAEAILERAKQEAMAKEELAKAEANALKEIQTVWNTMSAETKEAMIKKRAIERWNGTLPETMVGDSFLKWLMDSLAGA